MKEGIKIGYRLFDTAFVYNNESAIGKALTEVFQEKKIGREELFIVSKVSTVLLIRELLTRDSCAYLVPRTLQMWL